MRVRGSKQVEAWWSGDLIVPLGEPVGTIDSALRKVELLIYEGKQDAQTECLSDCCSDASKVVERE